MSDDLKNSMLDFTPNNSIADKVFPVVPTSVEERVDSLLSRVVELERKERERNRSIFSKLVRWIKHE